MKRYRFTNGGDSQEATFNDERVGDDYEQKRLIIQVGDTVITITPGWRSDPALVDIDGPAQHFVEEVARDKFSDRPCGWVKVWP